MSLKSFKIIELHPKEWTPSQEVHVIFSSGLMSLSATKGREQNLSRWKCEPLKLSDFPTFKSCGLKITGGCCVLSLCSDVLCTAGGPTAVCNLPLGVSISLWPVGSVCIYSKLSSLGLPDHHYCMDSWLSYTPGGRAFLLLSHGEEVCCSFAVFWKIPQCQCPDSSN